MRRFSEEPALAKMKKPSLSPEVPSRKLTRLLVRRCYIGEGRHTGRVHAGIVIIPAALGKGGMGNRKREGDGRTPVGRFELRSGAFRPDKARRAAALPGMGPLRRSMGWCDDPASWTYNRPVPAGHRARHERLWREDDVYDVVFPTSHNQRPRKLGAGSAIFFHLAKPGYPPTEGCVAISAADMRRLLPRLGKHVWLVVL